MTYPCFTSWKRGGPVLGKSVRRQFISSTLLDLKMQIIGQSYNWPVILHYMSDIFGGSQSTVLYTQMHSTKSYHILLKTATLSEQQGKMWKMVPARVTVDPAGEVKPS